MNMKYFLVKINDNVKIVKVEPLQEDEFRKEHAGTIKAEADSLMQLLQQLGKLQL